MYSQKIYCLYQKELIKKHNFDSWGLPEQGKSIHRLLIYGDRDEEFKLDVLTELHLPVKWIIFAEFQESAEFLKARLSFLQRWHLSGQGGGTGVTGQLYFLITDSLNDFQFVRGDGLWSDGAGIALPAESWNEENTKQAINVQVGMRLCLIPTIQKDFHCSIVAHTDADGYNVLWDDNFRFAPQVDAWAQETVLKYPWRKDF